MKPLIRPLAAIGFVALLATAAPAAKEPSVPGGVLAFEVHDLDGRVVTSGDDRFKGKVILLDLWGSWCPPCLTEIPTFNDLSSRYADEGLVVVGMAFEYEADPDKRRRHLRQFAREHEVGYLLLDGGAIEDFGKTLPMIENARGFPIEIIIDREGRVTDVRNGYGYSKRWARRLERRLAERLSRGSGGTK